MVGMLESSYYRVPSGGRKGNRASKLTYHKENGYVDQATVVNAVKEILSHEFIDCRYWNV